MNKTALVTLCVDPENHQIVKYTFENVWLDFLPAAWLVRIDGIRASMTTFQPFEGVWLPRGMEVSALGGSGLQFRTADPIPWALSLEARWRELSS